MVARVEANEFERAQKLDAQIFMTHLELLKDWIASDKKPQLHIKVDTGLTRQGFYACRCWRRRGISLNLNRDYVVGICTHFANVEDVLEHEYADLQLKRFAEAQAEFDARGFKLLAHAASSASTLILREPIRYLPRRYFALRFVAVLKHATVIFAVERKSH